MKRIFWVPLVSRLIILFYSKGYSQANYQKGIVITNQLDTIKGYIDQGDWLSNPQSISFALSPEGTDSRKFTTRDVGYFEIWGSSRYARYSVSISMDPVELSKLSESPMIAARHDSVFLEILQRGKNASLFSYRDQIKNRFYFLESNGPTPVELGYQKYLENNSVKHLCSGPFRCQDEHVIRILNTVTKATTNSQRTLRDFSLLNVVSVVPSVVFVVSLH